MNIKHIAVAGTMESSDIMITIDDNEGCGIEIDLTSSVEKQFGDQIRAVMTQCLKDLGINDAKVTAVDKGALDCVIQARMKTAIYRACDSTDFVWGGAK